MNALTKFSIPLLPVSAAAIAVISTPRQATKVSTLRDLSPGMQSASKTGNGLPSFGRDPP
jgi:hypothetical protein